MSVIAATYDDIDLDGRGYDPDFLSICLPLPTLRIDRGDVPMFVAVNIDGREPRRDVGIFDADWPAIEDHVLAHAMDMKVSVVSGPILHPHRHWKIVAMVRRDGTLSVTAYLLCWRAGVSRTFQVPVWRIAELTGLGLDAYLPADPLEINSLPRKLTQLDHIVL